MVRLFGRVSDDLDDEEDELNESLNHEAHPVASEEKINHAANTNGASVVHTESDRVSDNAAASLHATSTKASPDQQSLHVNRTATGRVHTVSEAPSSGLDEHSSAPSADIDSSQLVPNLKGASIPSQILHTTEPIQAGKDAVKPYSDQMPRTDKPKFSSASDSSGDTCHTDLSNSCFTRGSSGEATANIADGRIRRRIEPIYPADDSQLPATFPPSSTIHATIVPLRFSDRFPVNGRTSLGGSNVVISFLTRVRDFFLDIFGSSIHLTTGKTDTREYNLSAIDLCPRHLSAIGALLSYGLLSHPDTTSSLDLMITLSERQLRGLRSLDQCFRLLDQRTYVFNSDHLNPQIAVHHRVLVLLKNAEDPVMANCNTATQLLNMVFAPNNDSSSHRNSQETAKYNILQLFLAYQYRIQLHRSLANVSYHRAPISPTAHVLYPWWISGGDRELVPHIQSTCPKLPDFLSHLMHLPTVDPPVSPTPGSTCCSNTSSTIVPREPVASHQRSSNTVMREQIVVPAALAGSRKDTALMRLNNRVRLLERNVFSTFFR
ncbi:unnamed protein product [Dicrocoelium dendriticum]|nr:unnamed protein product [Dicrocoelium dendriticum]